MSFCFLSAIIKNVVGGAVLPAPPVSLLSWLVFVAVVLDALNNLIKNLCRDYSH